MHLLVFSPQSHFIWADRDLRIERQCAHWETGRPFLLMCWSGRSVAQEELRVSTIDQCLTAAVVVVVVAVAVAGYTTHPTALGNQEKAKCTYEKTGN